MHHHHHHPVIQESSPDLRGHDLRLKSRTLMGTSCSAPGLPEGGGRAPVSADEPLSAPGEKDEMEPEGTLVWCWRLQELSFDNKHINKNTENLNTNLPNKNQESRHFPCCVMKMRLLMVYPQNVPESSSKGPDHSPVCTGSIQDEPLFIQA